LLLRVLRAFLEIAGLDRPGEDLDHPSRLGRLPGAIAPLVAAVVIAAIVPPRSAAPRTGATPSCSSAAAGVLLRYERIFAMR
jgi:hypothetical protein